MKTCPECAEEVREAARLCRFCGHRFEGNESLGRGRKAALQRRRRSAAVVAVGAVALLGGLLIGAGQFGEGAERRDEASARGPNALASATPPRCSEGAVATELERRKLLDRRDFSGVEQVACRDLTGDQIDDAIFVRGSTGSAGTKGWGVLVGQKRGRWDPSLFRQAETGVQVNAQGETVVRRQPIYQPEDPHCCPTGGTEVEVYVYRGGRFEAVEQFTEPPTAPQSATPDEPGPSVPEGEEEDSSSDKAPCGYGEGLCTPEEDEAVKRETEAYCEEQRRDSETAGEEYVPDYPC